jgi:ubiquinone/menaquinone biosynthesis C-methylase UbiE
LVDPREILKHIPGGRILDVATGSGGFIHLLMNGLKDYTEIIGVDNNDIAALHFADSFKEKTDIHFKKMDAHQLGFPDSSFDTVCLANSLHHFENPRVALQEMMRVLRPCGYFILAEMYRDRQTETQMTHVHLHHWWAAVDRINGGIHNETFLREEINAFLTQLELKSLALYDLSDIGENPKNVENLTELDLVIDQYIQRAAGHPILQDRGEELRKRLKEIGVHSAASLFAVGTKTD